MYGDRRQWSGPAVGVVVQLENSRETIYLSRPVVRRAIEISMMSLAMQVRLLIGEAPFPVRKLSPGACFSCGLYFFFMFPPHFPGRNDDVCSTHVRRSYPIRLWSFVSFFQVTQSLAENIIRKRRYMTFR